VNQLRRRRLGSLDGKRMCMSSVRDEALRLIAQKLGVIRGAFRQERLRRHQEAVELLSSVPPQLGEG